MKISTCEEGKTYKLLSIEGDEKTKSFLKTLGLIENSSVTLISKSATNFILNIKDSRYAIDKALASNITVEAL